MKKQMLLLVSLLTLTACNNKTPEKVEKVEYDEEYVIQDSYDNSERRINAKDQTLPRAAEEEEEAEEESPDEAKQDTKEEGN